MNAVGIFALLIASFLAGVFLRVGPQTIPTETSRQSAKSEVGTATSSILNLPLRYFTADTFRYGSARANYESPSPMNGSNMDVATLEAGYQSFPSTAISLPETYYSNKIEALPPLKSWDQIVADEVEFDPEDGKMHEPRYRDLIRKYPEFASRFLPGDDITAVTKFDVDGDGRVESIITTCGYGNHCPHSAYIVKGNKIIFTVSGSQRVAIEKSDTGNGFYLHWEPDSMAPAACCPMGYIKVRFAYESGRFMPVYEQKILYVTVRNTE
ncbi:hypothetical protein EXS57_03650 [Candidatus Kaiserbacteria bacterium]|nr:hypothetical protein [Candidatus Kaiserbacteria bacterium]